MDSWADGVFNIILDRSVEELILAILLALALSTAGASLGVWLCRSRRDETTRLTVVLLGVCLMGMTIGGAFAQQTYDPRRKPAGTVSATPGAEFPGPAFPRPGQFFRMVAVLDADGNGHVSREELHEAAVALDATDRLEHLPDFGFGGPRSRWDDGRHSPASDPLSTPARDLRRTLPEHGGGPPTPGPAADPVELSE